jgi:aminopeptidase
MPLEYGAKQAVEECMRLVPGDRFVVISDRHTLDVASAIVSCARSRTKEIKLFVLEDYGARPLPTLPKEIASSLEKATASIFAAESYPGEVKTVRRALLEIVTAKQIRHGHMIGITPEIMEQGMSADYALLRQVSAKVHEHVKRASQIRVLTAKGTDFTASFSLKIPWIVSDGTIRKEKWGNLPDGEVWTCVQDCHGKVVIDGVLGDHFSRKYGLLAKNPLTIAVKQSRIVSVESALQALKEEYLKYIATDANSNRVGEFAFGTNLSVKRLIGNMLQDEKFPGVHFAVGHCYPKITGVDWNSDVHCDAVIQKPTVIVDGKKVMEKGKYLI